MTRVHKIASSAPGLIGRSVLSRVPAGKPGEPEGCSSRRSSAVYRAHEGVRCQRCSRTRRATNSRAQSSALSPRGVTGRLAQFHVGTAHQHGLGRFCTCLDIHMSYACLYAQVYSIHACSHNHTLRFCKRLSMELRIVQPRKSRENAGRSTVHEIVKSHPGTHGPYAPPYARVAHNRGLAN